MALISPPEMARHLHAAGFRGNDLVIGVAVGMAESGGRSDARALTSREDSRGVWQINIMAHRWAAGMNLNDPRVNAQAAKRVHDEVGSWRPWSVYTNRRYLLFMPIAAAAVPAAMLADKLTPDSVVGAIDDQRFGGDGDGGIAGTAKAAVDAVRQAFAYLIKTGEWIRDPNSWVRVAKVAVGGALVVSGLLIVAGKPVAGTATKIAKKV